jgi:hypothetical protein
MPGSTAALSAATAMTLSSKAWRSCTSGTLAVAPSGSTVAALLIRMSMRPGTRAVRTARARCASSPRSAGTIKILSAETPCSMSVPRVAAS